MKNKQDGLGISLTGKNTYKLNNVSDVQFTNNEQKTSDTEK